MLGIVTGFLFGCSCCAFDSWSRVLAFAGWVYRSRPRSCWRRSALLVLDGFWGWLLAGGALFYRRAHLGASLHSTGPSLGENESTNFSGSTFQIFRFSIIESFSFVKEF